MKSWFLPFLEKLQIWFVSAAPSSLTTETPASAYAAILPTRTKPKRSSAITPSSSLPSNLTWASNFPSAASPLPAMPRKGIPLSPCRNKSASFIAVDPQIHLLDAKYDELHNYAFARKQGAIPLIDYNPRNEKLVREALLQHGYDRNGWPFVSYCSLPMRPNGFDAAAQRLSFSCFKQCVKSKDPTILELYRNCPHRSKLLGFSTHVPIAERPRLLLEIPRGTERYRQLHCLRSASEKPTALSRRTTPSSEIPPCVLFAGRPWNRSWVS